MSRLVDANEVVKAILAERNKIPRTISSAPYGLGTEKPFHAGDQMRGGIRKALRCIEQAPTVDAVAVTRCRECKHRKYDDIFEMIWCNRDSCTKRVKPDDFCSYGEKEGAE